MTLFMMEPMKEGQSLLWIFSNYSLLVHEIHGRFTQQEAVRGAWPADGRRGWPGRLPVDPREAGVVRLRLPGLEERLTGNSGIRGDGVRVRQAEELHLHEGLSSCFVSFKTFLKMQHSSVLDF